MHPMIHFHSMRFGNHILWQKRIIIITRPHKPITAWICPKALKEDVPVLGICRGIQFINAALGGTLYQDIPLQHPSSVNHHQKAPYDIPAHEVAIVEGSPLYDCLSSTQLAVNSCHHQAIRELATGLEVMACSPDGLVEAVYLPGKRFLWAVQWHPEFSYKTDENSRKILRAFVEAAERP